MSTQNMSNSKMGTQRMINLHICSAYDSKSKSVHKMDISFNTSKVKYTKDEEPSNTDILLIYAPVYSKLFKCRKEFLNDL